MRTVLTTYNSTLGTPTHAQTTNDDTDKQQLLVTLSVVYTYILFNSYLLNDFSLTV